MSSNAASRYSHAVEREHSVTPLAEALGRRLRELREESDVSADRLAHEARRIGLSWQRSTVAMIESGKRRITLEEFFVLPSMLYEAGGLDLTLADLIPDVGAVENAVPGQGDVLQLAGRIAMPPSTLKGLTQGWLETPGMAFLLNDEESARVSETRSARRSLLDQLPPESHEEAEASSKGEAEYKAARSLGVLAGLIGPASYLLWGRSLTAERDAREAERHGPQDSERARRTQRGHVTRELLAELRTLLRERGILDTKDA